jgi:6-pyruvoyltetrahydropterin/6-carboxytetrahydropterin synthase
MTGKTTVGFTFDLNLAHYAAHEAEGHQNKALHGHSYTVRIFFAADPDPVSGYAVDLPKVQTWIADVKGEAEARAMNDSPGMGYSMETLAAWIAKQAQGGLPYAVESVEVTRAALGMVCRYHPDPAA